MKLDAQLNRLCETAACTVPATPKTTFCKKHATIERVRRSRAAMRVRIAAEITELDVPDDDTIREKRHWYRGEVRVSDVDIIWCLEFDARKGSALEFCGLGDDRESAA